MNKETSKNVLFEFDDICKDLEIPFCLGQGTALGFYRDGEFINSDTDIDVRIFCSKEKVKELFNKMKECGFKIGQCHCAIIGDGYELSRHTMKDVLLDVLFVTEVSRRKFYQSFDKVNFEGREFNLPHPIEDYLAYEYGVWKEKNNIKSRGRERTPHPYVIGKAIDFNFEDYMEFYNER